MRARRIGSDVRTKQGCGDMHAMWPTVSGEKEGEIGKEKVLDVYVVLRRICLKQGEPLGLYVDVGGEALENGTSDYPTVCLMNPSIFSLHKYAFSIISLLFLDMLRFVRVNEQLNHNPDAIWSITSYLFRGHHYRAVERLPYISVSTLPPLTNVLGSQQIAVYESINR
jgi:hypothetical protein